MDEAIGMGVFNITFTGGDPMLRKDIYSLISHVRDTGRAISTMFTPGVRLAGRAAQLKDAGLYSVYVILSNVSPEKHDEMVGTPGTFELAVRGIRECIDSGILTGIATYVTRERLNDGTIDQLIDFAGELGVHEVLLSDPLPTGKMLRNEQFILDKAERERLVAMQKDYNTRPKGTKIFTNSCVKGPTGVGCVAGNKWVHVTAVGEVSPCDYTPLSFGNVKNGGLAPVWNRIQRHATYSRHSDECRIQDYAFRRRYIDRIPEGAVLPYPIDRVES
ncbi:MAG TPA: radical SAM protein [Candidatus Methanoperedenaceae archaeon]|nr:radical SAM protein [Candidatus Methanoperedenaceae archaeon]